MKPFTRLAIVLSICGLGGCLTVFLLSAIVNAGSTSAPGLSWWITSQVDTFSHNNYDNTSIAMDAGGKTHLSYVSNGDLRYAILSGTTWITQVVDIGAGASGPSLALDVSGTPHIAYLALFPAATTGNVRYASLSGTNWITQTVDENPYIGGANGCKVSLAIDDSGHPHMSYGAAPSLYYAVLTSTTWITQGVDNQVYGAMCSAIDVDSLGVPQIVYYRMGQFNADLLQYAILNGSSWITQTITQCGAFGSCKPNSLKLDNAHRSHILYNDSTTLNYGVFSGTQWSLEKSFFPVERNFGGSLAIDPDGVPHISYAGQYGQDLIYATQILTGWTSQTVDDSLGVGIASSIALSDSEHIIIGYINTYLDRVQAANVWHPVAYVYLPLIVKN
jgi:hypothetical protein